VSQPVMGVQLGVETGRLPESDGPDDHFGYGMTGHTGRSTRNRAGRATPATSAQATAMII